MALQKPKYRVQKKTPSKSSRRTPSPPSQPPRLSTEYHHWSTPRRSQRLNTVLEQASTDAQYLPQQTSSSAPQKVTTQPKSLHVFPSPESNTPPKTSRKRSRIIRHTSSEPISKRARLSTEDPVAGNTLSWADDRKGGPVDHWARTQHWPQQYFEENTMAHLLARKKSSSSLSRTRRSEASSVAGSSSDQKPREEKSAPYKDARYETLLATKGSFMDKSELDITPASKRLCKTLLEKSQATPIDSLFRDDLFETTCRKIRTKNEARVIQDIGRLIVPSVETLATYGATNLNCLIESVNEGWNNSIPVTTTRPQPDYAVGFRREAFTEAQLEKLQPFVGTLMETSYFMGTYYQYFPFLTCEVKCGASALDIADRQNAHSMTLALRALIELYRLVGREKELHREIAAFSLSHDHTMVRIYGHYAVIDGKNTSFYRHPIYTFDFTTLEGKEKWTAYRFTKNVYDIWMPKHFQRLCSVIDGLPADLNFEVSDLPDSGFSQDLQSQLLSSSDQSMGPLSQPSVELQDVTPDTSFTDKESSRRPRKRRAARSPNMPT